MEIENPIFQTKKNPFKSFWMAGFECADQLNSFGNRVDLLDITGHLNMIDQDYERLEAYKIRTVREGIRWSHIEKTPYEYDWSDVAKMIEVGKAKKVQQIWDICHFGFPDDLTPLHPMFARRFSALCRAFVTFYRSVDADSVLIVTPINEVSFLSWLGGDVRGTAPYCINQGWEVKYRLMKAYIEGIEAILEVDSSVRILTTEPLVNIVPHFNASVEEIRIATSMHDDQFQVTDILSGRVCPELRGKPEYLDILGYNYYYNNQWALSTNEFLHWQNPNNDSRFVPLNQLLLQAYDRYKCPMVLTETSHPKEDRPLWVKDITRECCLSILAAIPLWGICWYPIIDRPDWDNLTDWHSSGLWDVDFNSNNLERKLHLPTAHALLIAQHYIC